MQKYEKINKSATYSKIQVVENLEDYFYPFEISDYPCQILVI